MSLYYEAAPYLHEKNLRSQVFGCKSLKSTPKQIFALVSEASKWSPVLKEVIENAQLLTHERRKVTSLSPSPSSRSPTLSRSGKDKLTDIGKVLFAIIIS